MDQNSGSQNKNPGFFQQNQVAIIVVALIAVLAIIYFVSRNNDTPEEQNTNNEQTGQTGENNPENNENTNPNPEPSPAPSSNNGQANGNVSVQGMLLPSDMPIRGNLMVDSDKGKVYVSTSRDFSNLVNQKVTLNAQGSINSFTFLGFNGSTGIVAGSNTDDKAKDRNVSFSGNLAKSDDMDNGNYMISSDKTKVYLQSVHDYNSWLGSTVKLSAKGTLNSFTGAVLSK